MWILPLLLVGEGSGPFSLLEALAVVGVFLWWGGSGHFEDIW